MAVIALALSACAGKGARPQLTAPAADSAYGNYLAGDYAAAQRDTGRAANYFQRALAADPQATQLYRPAFNMLLADAQYDKALPLARKLVEIEPVADLPRFFLALDNINKGDYAAAEKSIAALPPGGLNGLMGPLLRAWTTAERKDFAAALAALDPLKSTLAFEQFRVFHTALIADMAGQTDLADSQYRDSILVYTGATVRNILAYGNFLERQGRFDAAAELYRAWRAKLGGDPQLGAALAALDQTRQSGKPPARLNARAADGMADALYNIAALLAADNSRDLSVGYARMAQFLRPSLAEAAFMVGGNLEVDEFPEPAIAAFRQVGPQHPLYVRAQLHIADLLNDMGKKAEAQAIIRQLSASNSGDREVQIGLADMLRANEEFAEARLAYDRVIALSQPPAETDWVFYYARGICLERTQKWDEAEADFHMALKLRPNDPFVLNYLGYSWVDRGLNIAQAQKMIEQAVALRPNDGFITDSLGWVLFRQGKFVQALPYLEQALLLQPDDSTITEHVGDAYWMLGRRMEAYFQWRHAAELSPDAAGAARLAAKLGSDPTRLVGDQVLPQAKAQLPVRR